MIYFVFHHRTIWGFYVIHFVRGGNYLVLGPPGGSKRWVEAKGGLDHPESRWSKDTCQHQSLIIFGPKLYLAQNFVNKDQIFPRSQPIESSGRDLSSFNRDDVRQKQIHVAEVMGNQNLDFESEWFMFWRWRGGGILNHEVGGFLTKGVGVYVCW